MTDMKRSIKLIGGVLLLIGMAAQAAIVSTNTTEGETFVLRSGRASVYSITLSTTALSPATVRLYDNTNAVDSDPYFGTNYVTAEYISRASYPTTIVDSYISPVGFTNWYTNTGIYTYTVTNAAATNELTPNAVLAVGANSVMAYDMDSLFVKGITVMADTNIGIIVNYRSGQ